MLSEKLDRLKSLDRETCLLGNMMSILGWDQAVCMPPKGINDRSKQVSLLAKIHHEYKTSDEIGEILDYFEKQQDIKDQLSANDLALIKVIIRQYNRDIKLPATFVARFSEVTSIAEKVWEKAKDENNFKLFAPHLEKIIDLNIEKTELIGFDEHPYDALLDEFEPWMTTKTTAEVFSKVRKKLTDLTQSIIESDDIDDDFLFNPFPVDRQKQFINLLVSDLGYDKEKGRMDESTHPFSVILGSDDVRITNRYSEDSFQISTFAGIHECGHALYDLGFDEALKGSSLASSPSLGLDESQSRTWENILGHSLPYWEYYYPTLQSFFPDQLKGTDLMTFYRAINRVRPSLVRTEADEVTYGLHIILRFELEQDLISGKLKVSDVPEAWNEKMKEFLGITPETDSDGALQDVHWSAGVLGYFPTYLLGTLYGSQFCATMKKEMPSFDEDLKSGNFKKVLDWSRENIHRHGAIYTAGELCERVSGESLNPDYFIAYLKEKYSDIYGF